jgi:UDP-glucose 4-epimerase
MAPYGVSKLAAESYCRVFSQVYGLETVSLRYFNVFGPRQHPDSEYAAVIPRFLRRMLAGIAP